MAYVGLVRSERPDCVTTPKLFSFFNFRQANVSQFVFRFVSQNPGRSNVRNRNAKRPGLVRQFRGRNYGEGEACAEKSWKECHRQIIADYLIANGHHVVHLVDAVNREDGRLTAFATLSDRNVIHYPANRPQLRLDL